ncbi:MAG TPA: N-acetyltransferase family protein, partial [Candidatus Obscuribacterales bacterium]
MNIRDAVETDLAAIVNIYNASIPNRLATADTEPVSVESRLAWYKQHTSTSRPLWVMEIDSSVVGWLSFRSFYGRPAYHTTAEISIYVSPNYHRQGVAQQLLEKAICQSPTLGLKTLVGFIFAHNEPSLQLFTKYDFERWGYLPKIAELDGIERD